MIVRIYTGSDGESHFEDIDLKYEASGNSASAPPEKPESMTFRTQQPGVDLDFHPAPRRQYIVSLAGEVEIGLGSGEKRIFGAGDVMLADDTTGARAYHKGGGQPAPRLYCDTCVVVALATFSIVSPPSQPSPLRGKGLCEHLTRPRHTYGL